MIQGFRNFLTRILSRIDRIDSGRQMSCKLVILGTHTSIKIVKERFLKFCFSFEKIDFKKWAFPKFSMVFHCNFHWIWLDLDQNPQKSTKIPENFRKINLSRPSEGVRRRARAFLSATLHGESISDGFGAIRSDPALENLRKTF